MKNLKGLFFLCFLLVLVSPSHSEEYATGNPISPIETGSAGLGYAAAKPMDYGTGNWIEMNISSAGFIPLGDGQWTHYLGSTGWANRSGGNNLAACMSPRFPNGASLKGVNLYFNDTNANQNISYAFYQNDLLSGTTNTLFTFTSNAAPGIVKDYYALSTPHTVDSDRKTYTFCVFSPVADESIQYSGVTFWYQLQVTPPPAINSFSDVPPSHPFFQYVEALNDAGITAGCGGGNYCPDDPLTRGQMAVFLSRALGLFWAYYGF